MRMLLLPLFIAPALLSQAPVAVLSVTDALTGDTRLAPSSRALIRLTRSVVPGSISVQIGGRQVAVMGGSGDHFHALLPSDMSAGMTTIVVTSSGVSTPPFAVELVSHAPVLAATSTWPGIYCPALSPWGTSLVAHGLGATQPTVPAGVVAPTAPVASTVLKPTVTVAGREAEVLSSALAPGRSNDGHYVIEFRIPPDLKEGLYPVQISIGGHTSNTQPLRVASATTFSAAGGSEGQAAVESIMSAYACATPLATGEMAADPHNPPGVLVGTTVKVKDAAGVEHLAPILYASSRQVNYIVPRETAVGPATVSITSANGSVSSASLEVHTIAPNIFASPTFPAAFAASVVIRVRDGVQTVEPVLQTVNGRIEPAAIDLGPPSDEVFLSLFGTGLRSRSSLENVKLRLSSEDLVWGFASIDLPVIYAGAQGQFPGLDQVNVKLPRSLQGRFDAYLDVNVIVDGKSSPQNTILLFKGEQ
jgi:uncharacterized protein (TIGR03437 family)